MKQLFTILLALVAITASAQKRKGKAEEVQSVPDTFYEVVTEGTAYHMLADTAEANPTVPPQPIAVGRRLLVTGKLGSRWLRVSYQGVKYFVPASKLQVDTGSQLGLDGSTAPGGNSGSGATGGGHSIQTGPRGGRYYINSNGNKTYIKR